MVSKVSRWFSSFFSNTKAQENFEIVGKVFDYQIEEYHLNLEILSKTQVMWTYISAPNGATGKTGLENCTIQEITKGVYLFYWTEKDGSNVVDIFNTNTKEVFVNFTDPNSKMYNARIEFSIRWSIKRNPV